jgi:hypothetical protein
MAAVIPVGTNAVKISGTASKPYLISNDPASQTIIYLGQYSNVSAVNYGVKLLPGASLTWTEISQEVWAISASTNTANVTVIYEAAATFSSQVSSLSSSNPQLLQTLVIPFTSGSPSGEVQTWLNDVNIASYTGLRITVQTNITAGGGTLSSALGCYIYFRGTQSAITVTQGSVTVQQTNVATWSINDTSGIPLLIKAVQSYDFAVNNTLLTNAYLGYNFGAQTPTGYFTIRLFGLTQPVATNKYLNVYGAGDTAKSGIMFNQGFGTGTSNVEIPSMSGAATLSMTTDTITPTSVLIRLYAYITGTPTLFYTGGYLSPGTLGSGRLDNITLPNAPIRVTGIIAGTGNVQVGITQPGL